MEEESDAVNILFHNFKIIEEFKFDAYNNKIK